jgi:hypothetical protein
MNRPLALVLLIAGFVAATSPVWAAPVDNGLAFDPDPAYPGQTVGFSAALDSTETGDGSCVLIYPSQEPAAEEWSCSYIPANTVTGYVVIPDDAPTGTPYAIKVCAGCGGEFGWERSDAVGVVAPPSVTVPTLHCKYLPSVYKSVVDGGLQVFRTSFLGPIGHVVPSGGSVVSSGSTITPYPALIPKLGHLAYPSASALVVGRCGIPVPTGPTDGVVVGQSPLPGESVPSNLLVTVSLTATNGPVDGGSAPPTRPPSPDPTPKPDKHPWWWRAQHPDRSFLAWTGGLLVVVVGAAGAHRVRVRRGPHAGVRTALVWAPDTQGRLSPSLVVRRQPSTYELEEPR